MDTPRTIGSLESRDISFKTSRASAHSSTEKEKEIVSQETKNKTQKSIQKEGPQVKEDSKDEGSSTTGKNKKETLPEIEFKEFSAKTRRFRSPELIAAGSYGKIYKCQDSELEKPVAIKVGEKFKVNLNEIHVLKAIRNHENGNKNIIQLLNDYETPNCVIMVLEYFDMNLFRYIVSRQEVISAQEVKSILRQVLEGLITLNELGYFHGDVKPSNIMINRGSNSIPCVKIIDFGGCTKPGKFDELATTYGMEPPEFFLGEYLGFKFDIWSLGCTAAFMIIKKYLFSNDLNVRMFQIVTLLGFPDPEYVSKSKLFHKVFCNRDGKIELLKTFGDYPYKQIPDLTKSIHGIWHNRDLHTFQMVLIRMLEFDPVQRASAHLLLTLPFFCE